VYREGIKVEGEIERRIEAEEVVDVEGRLWRETRDGEVEKGNGLWWRESEVVVVEKASSHFLNKVLTDWEIKLNFGAKFSIYST